MSDPNHARRSAVEISIGGVDVTDDVSEYFLSMSYTDNAEDESDDIQLQLEDRRGTWRLNWLNKMVQGDAATKGTKIRVAIKAENWWWDSGADVKLDCGEFALDTINISGPPSLLTIKGVALPFGSQVRQTKKSKAWEKYTLFAIASEIAASNGMKCMYESSANPSYKRAEQSRQSDIAFLAKLCKDAGISLKATDNTLVLFDQATYEAKPPIMTIKYGEENYSKYKFSTGQANVQYASCRVSYTDPASGGIIEGIVYAEDYDDDAQNNQRLEVYAKVSGATEAKELALKRLRLHNKYEKSGSFTLVGSPSLVAGVTIELAGWGLFDGKYIVQRAQHSVGNSGYTTQINIRHILEGY